MEQSRISKWTVTRWLSSAKVLCLLKLRLLNLGTRIFFFVFKVFAAVLSTTLFSFVKPWGFYIAQILYWKEMRKIKLLIKNLVLLGTKCSINRGFYPFENKGQMRDDAAEWVISLASGMRQTRFHLLVVCLWDGDSTKPQFPYF